MDENLAQYEIDLIKNMFQEQDSLPDIFEVANYKMIQPENKIVQAVFFSISILWKKEKSINTITLETTASSYFSDSDKLENFLDFIKENKAENDWGENVEEIIRGWKRREVKKLGKKLYKTTERNVIDFGAVLELNDKIQETISIGNEEEENPYDILTSEPIVEFQDKTLKRLFGGLLKGNLSTLGGEPGHTKTTLSIFMVNDFLEQGYKVLVFPNDGKFSEFLQKMVSLRTRIDSNLIVESNFTKANPYGRMTKEEFDKVKNEIGTIKEKYLKTKQLIIKDKTTDYREIRLLARKEKPDIVVVDTIQGVEMPEGDQFQNPAFGIPIILRSWKQIAKQLNCAFLLVAWWEAGGKRPRVGQAYSSKAMQRWSAKIWMLYYLFNETKIKHFKNIIEIINGKERFGESGINLVGIEPQYGNYTAVESLVDRTILSNYKQISKLPSRRNV